jgi:hypothetical protein
MEDIMLIQGPCSVHEVVVEVTRCLVPYSGPHTPFLGQHIRPGELAPLIMVIIPKIDIVGHLIHTVNYNLISTSCLPRGNIQEKWLGYMWTTISRIL